MAGLLGRLAPHALTHAISPLLALAGREADTVNCLGSGRIDDRLAGKYGSPFAVESALFRLRDSELAMEVTRSLFETAGQRSRRISSAYGA